MDWRLVAADTFYDSLDELDDTAGTAAVAEKLILRIMSAPLRTEMIGDTKMRGLRHRPSTGSLPELVLFYTAEEGVVTLFRLERDRAARAHD